MNESSVKAYIKKIIIEIEKEKKLKEKGKKVQIEFIKSNKIGFVMVKIRVLNEKKEGYNDFIEVNYLKHSETKIKNDVKKVINKLIK